jgi:spermidine synthase
MDRAMSATSRRHRLDITISESDGIRCLHFGTPWIQGAMDTAQPDSLVLAYVQQMMGWLLFLNPPAQLLQLGLGAGSLARFCHRHLPSTALTVVERSPEVIAAARTWFGLPRQGRRLQIVAEDAQHVLRSPALRHRFGVVQVDLYDEQAAGPVLDSLSFYRRCREALAEPGIAVFNLFGEHSSFELSWQRLRQVFEGRLLMFEPLPEGNTVVLAFRGPAFEIARPAVQARAALLGDQLGLDTRHWVRALCLRPDARVFQDPRAVLSI